MQLCFWVHDISDHSQLAGNPRRQPPRSWVKGGLVWAESPWMEAVRWSGKSQLFHGAAFLRSPPKLLFPLGSRGPPQIPPRLPGAALGREVTPGPLSPHTASRGRRSLPVDGTARPRRAAPAAPAARRGPDRPRGGGQGEPPAPPPAGLYRGKRRSRPTRRCSPSSSPSLPFWSGTCRVWDGNHQKMLKGHVAISSGWSNIRSWLHWRLTPRKEPTHTTHTLRSHTAELAVPEGSPTVTSRGHPTRSPAEAPGNSMPWKSRRCHTLSEKPVSAFRWQSIEGRPGSSGLSLQWFLPVQF